MSDPSFRVSNARSYRDGIFPSTSKLAGEKARDINNDIERDFSAIRIGNSSKEPSFTENIEKSAVVGTKRTRSSENPEASYFSLELMANPLHDDPLAVIVARAKRLRISDGVTDSRDREVRQTLCEKKEEKLVSGSRFTSNEVLLIPELPSLSGLPEELIIQILQDLDVFEIMSLRRTNRRLAHVTRARVLWMKHISLLLAHSQLSESPATFDSSLFSTSTIEQIALRPHIFDYKWFRNIVFHENPTSSRLLSTGWSRPEDIRYPILLPGGRWLIAACDDGRFSNSNICLWDLDHGKLKGLPEAQTLAEGRIGSLDVKMDRTGAFAFMAVLSEKKNATGTLVYRIDIYRINVIADKDKSAFHHIDSLPLDDRQAHEVKIYPQHGRILADLFDRVLIWAYSPLNMCAWMVTSVTRHNQRRFSHRSAHTITHTHHYILVADGDECVLRAFHIPPLFHRPAQLSALGLQIPMIYLELRLPSFSISLRFSTDRLVDISTILENPKVMSGLPSLTHGLHGGLFGQLTHTETINPHGGEDHLQCCSDPLGRVVLFIDAASCDSYLLCSFPIHDICPHSSSSDTLFLVSKDRRQACEQARSGSFLSPHTSSESARPFFVPVQIGGRMVSRGNMGALWVGSLSGISSALAGSSRLPRVGERNVVLMQSPDYDGGLMILSAPVTPYMMLGPGQLRIVEVEQGVTKTVLIHPDSEVAGARALKKMRVEEASVDEISGRVCVVETTMVMDWMRNQSEVRYTLRLLEYV